MTGRKFDKRKEKQDREYLEAIGPAVIASMRSARAVSPDLDFVVFVRRGIETSSVTSVPIEPLMEEMRDDPSHQVQAILKTIRKPPSHPLARWVVLANDEDKSFAVCSVIDASAVSSVGGSA